jgi:oxygen-independent coproporphyrinogen-3 oxidase
MSLVEKYNVQGPRYTSYPTVPYWDGNGFSEDVWRSHIGSRLSSKAGISLYIHLPYCESLCTYCGCNTRITVNHAVERPYIDAVLKEYSLYRSLAKSSPLISDLHLGGGTPTFFSPENLKYLLSSLFEMASLPEHTSFSFEGHPANTTFEHLQVLFEMGFRRMSLGIQDFDDKVQDIINRSQSVEQVESLTKRARELGYESVNYDLIYGLPLQTMDSLRTTVHEVIRLRPDRIAFYGYAHVPWVKPGQRKFTENDLPDDVMRLALYEMGREMLEAAGYIEIGMDHFALPHDAMYKAMLNGTLHRNFMGYTEVNSACMLGLGVSSISDSVDAFAQNVKTVEEYLKRITENSIPVFRGHFHTEEDLRLRRHILNLMCQLMTTWRDDELEEMEEVLDRLYEPIQDKLIVVNHHTLSVTLKGRRFVRNVCMAFDERLHQQIPTQQVFSKTV